MTKVLIVDDSKLVIIMIKKYLAPDGYEIITANGGREALNILETGANPDLILLDVVMDDIDGFQLIEKIKSNPETKDIPTLFVTSLDKGSDISKGLELGAEDYIIKPFTQNEIQSKVKRNLKVSHG